MPGRVYELLFDFAAGQYGYITRAQALEAGAARNTLDEMSRRGLVAHLDHGLYRFKAFPVGPLDAYMEAVLWPRGTTGVLSHETALELYGLSDASPDRIHITVPKTHRIRRVSPTVYNIHHAELEPSDVTWREGIPLTTVERTIRDCHKAHVRRGLLEQALEQARARGLISAGMEVKLRKEIGTSADAVGGDAIPPSPANR